ncbi:MAG TPA: tetratricopeptide repeat protein [Micropepsaceae bacterium]|nr:tetratricopeptide repeat protein [Micropepsaceae bacterium]
MNQAPLLQAFEYYKTGRLEPAAELLHACLRNSPSDGPANHLLGVIYYRQGRFAAARDHLAHACASPGATAEMYNNYGAALKGLDDLRGAVAAYRCALALDPDYADALSNLGVIYLAQGETHRAIETLRRAVALKPELTDAQLNLRNAYRDVVPPWHFAMINDHPRNAAYRQAIAQIVPGKRVLEIGTGAGLLAMIAASAGAASVTTCEGNTVIAERAREIIASNGLADRVTVIAKHSTGLSVGQDLAERAEVLITETFSSDLLSEGILPAIEHAHRELLIPNPTIIPDCAAARGYLAGGPELATMLFAGRSEGFDLSAFNDFAPPVFPVTLNNVPHAILSDDFELFRFDLASPMFEMQSREIAIPVTKSGIATAVVQWIRLDVDGVSHYENRPSRDPQAEAHWTQILYRFPQPFAVAAGTVVHILAGHNRRQLSITRRA